jgi:U2-associated protein SR140
MVFAHFKSVYDSLHAYSGNISADVFKAQVNVVLEVWERWSVHLCEHKVWADV